MQGIILALEALVAAGSQMVGTPQAGKMEVTRHEALRDDDTKEMEDKPAFEKYLKGVRKEGASLCLAVPFPMRHLLAMCTSSELIRVHRLWSRGPSQPPEGHPEGGPALLGQYWFLWITGPSSYVRNAMQLSH